MKHPLFSIILPTFNRPEFLNQAIDSVLSQTVRDFECIIVDDASSTPVCTPGDTRIRVIRHAQNSGGPLSRNTGINNATGRYISFLDDDDLYTKDHLEILLEGLRRAPVSICWRVSFNGSVLQDRRLDGEVLDIILNSMTPHLGQVGIVRDLTPRFDERFQALEDVEWWIRTTKQSKVTTVPRAGLLYRKHSGPRNRNGLEVRVQCSLLLLGVHRDYFRTRPKAEAFRWKRIGIMAGMLGDNALARYAFLRSLRRHPRVSTIKHLLFSSRRSRSKIEIPPQIRTGIL